MQSLESSNSPTDNSRVFTTFVILLRVLVGAVFVVSGFVKMIDIYGFIFKIEEYLAVWHFVVPRTIILTGAMLLCVFEFAGGVMVATGIWKRMAVWWLTLIMCGMTLLTAWIYFADPVDDCGCFGDFVKLSNGATFLKNIVLLAALLWLSKVNSRVKLNLFHPSIQWIPITLLVAYIVLIGLYGYNVQPMLDFRPYPVGTQLSAAQFDESGNEADEMLFIYSKDGREKTFDIDHLPDESWTFVDAISPDDDSQDSSLTIYDDSEDVTEEVLDGEGEMLILVIAEPARMDISYTFALNELYEWAISHDVRMVALIAPSTNGIEVWRDLSMADYPCYTVEDTKLKELSRGVMSLVYLDNGQIIWKRALGSLTPEDIESITSDSVKLSTFAPESKDLLIRLTLILIVALIVVYLIQDTIQLIARKLRRLDKKLLNEDVKDSE